LDQGKYRLKSDEGVGGLVMGRDSDFFKFFCEEYQENLTESNANS
jgi:hypothetical protein